MYQEFFLCFCQSLKIALLRDNLNSVKKYFRAMTEMEYFYCSANSGSTAVVLLNLFNPVTKASKTHSFYCLKHTRYQVRQCQKLT